MALLFQDHGGVTALLKRLTANIAKIDVFQRSVLVTYKTHADAAAARRVLIPNRDAIFNDNVIIEWARLQKKVRHYHFGTLGGTSGYQRKAKIWGVGRVF